PVDPAKSHQTGAAAERYTARFAGRLRVRAFLFDAGSAGSAARRANGPAPVDRRFTGDLVSGNGGKWPRARLCQLALVSGRGRCRRSWREPAGAFFDHLLLPSFEARHGVLDVLA